MFFFGQNIHYGVSIRFIQLLKSIYQFIPISVKIPVTAIIAFAVSWGVVAFFYRFIPKVAKWIFG
jgi:hypothetical protein